MTQVNVLRFPSRPAPPAPGGTSFDGPTIGLRRPDPAHLARLKAIAFKPNGKLTDVFMLQLLRRATETRSIAEVRSYHPDALPTLCITRVLAATIERIVGQEMTDSQRATATESLWPIAEKITAHSDEAVPHALAATIAHFIRLNLPQEESPHDRS